MNDLILKLRKALVHYEDCVDVCAAEHIMMDALMALNKNVVKLLLSATSSLRQC